MSLYMRKFETHQYVTVLDCEPNTHSYTTHKNEALELTEGYSAAHETIDNMGLNGIVYLSEG